MNCEKSTGKYLTELLKNTLDKLGIDIGMCVGNSTDGAANMQGPYKGFSAFLSALPEKRVRKKKRMPGELLDDEPVASSDAAFEVNVHNVILDTVAASIDRRFSANAKLASDFACLDPKN